MDLTNVRLGNCLHSNNEVTLIVTYKKLVAHLFLPNNGGMRESIC